MGRLTHSQIVTEAIELAGNTGLTTRAQKYLELILRDLYEKSPWPFSGLGTIDDAPITPQTIASGVQTLQLGAGGGGLDTTVRSVRRVWICTNGQTDFTELQVEHISTMDMPVRAYTGVSGVSNGRPLRCLVHLNTNNSMTLYFDPKPNKTYAVWTMTEGYLTSLGTYSASLVSAYPNDLTVVQGVFAMCLKHQQDERYGVEWAEYLRMAKEDRARFMQASNANSRMRLSPRSFRPRRTGRDPWDWMGEK